MRDLGIVSGELDLLVGGPPCQTFSTTGKRATVQDPRGTLLWQFLHFVEELQPKMFVMENVRGLMSARCATVPSRIVPTREGHHLKQTKNRGRSFSVSLSISVSPTGSTASR